MNIIKTYQTRDDPMNTPIISLGQENGALFIINEDGWAETEWKEIPVRNDSEADNVTAEVIDSLHTLKRKTVAYAWNGSHYHPSCLSVKRSEAVKHNIIDLILDAVFGEGFCDCEGCDSSIVMPLESEPDPLGEPSE